MKFVHTSDWHIGLKPRHVAGLGEELAAARYRTVKKIRDLANTERVDFTVVAGDVFDDHGVGTQPIKRLGEILIGFNHPVYVIPGNHDHWTVGGFWGGVSEAWPANVKILSERVAVEIPGGLLFPCPPTQKLSIGDPTSWIPTPNGKQIRVGLAHGSIVGAALGNAANGIDAKAAQNAQLHYLALGDTHSFQTYETDGVIRTAYSGSPEPSSFAEKDPGHVALVEIDSEGNVSHQKITVGEFTWYSMEFDLQQTAGIPAVKSRLAQYLGPKMIWSLKLKGLFKASQWQELDTLEIELQAACSYFKLNRTKLIPHPEDDSWVDDLPEGYMRTVGQELKSKSAIDPIAARALIELYLLAGGTGQ